MVLSCPGLTAPRACATTGTVLETTVEILGELVISEKRVTDLAEQIEASWDRSFITAYLGWGYARTDGPLVYQLVGALMLLSMNAHPDTCAYLGGKVHANYWGLCIGPSGYSRKSTALELAMEIQEAADPSLIGGEAGSKEGLEAQLAAQPQQGVFYEEFGDFLSSTAGGSYLGPLRERLVKLYDCRAIRRTYSQSVQVIDQTRLSLMAGGTASYLEKYTDSTDWEGGFLGRWMIVYAEPDRYMPTPGSRPDLKDWAVDRLREVRATSGTTCMGLEADAQVYWDAWSRATRKQCLQSTEKWVASAGARTQMLAVKLAMLLALDAGLDISRPWRMTLPILQIAVKIAEMHFDSLGYVVRELCGTRFLRERRNVMRAIRTTYNHDGQPAEVVPMSAILNGTSPRMEKRDVIRVIDTLIAEGSVFNRGIGDNLIYSLYPTNETEKRVL